MKKFAILMIVGMFWVFGLAETGTVNLVFDNGSVYSGEGKTYYAFDVKAWMSGGSDVLGDGMVYVEYPAGVFGETLADNGKLSVSKEGIFAGSEPLTGSELYRIVNITDTRADVFAVTFASNFNDSNPDFKQYYAPVSTDENAPSLLLHVVMEAEAEGSGNVLFPADIPGLDQVYYDYEAETFSGGLDITAAVEPVDVSFTHDPDDPEDDDPEDDPQAQGNVKLANFNGHVSKSVVGLQWITLNETDIAGFVIKRASGGGEYAVVASYEDNAVLEGETASVKPNRYRWEDDAVKKGVRYTYMLEAADIYGNIIPLESVTIRSKDKDNPKMDPADPRGAEKLMALADFTLEAGYPNPFNPQFTVPFTLSAARHIDIKLYDMSGKVVRDVAGGRYPAGNYELRVNCSDLGSGVYFLRTRTEGRESVQKMLLVK